MNKYYCEIDTSYPYIIWRHFKKTSGLNGGDIIKCGHPLEDGLFVAYPPLRLDIMDKNLWIMQSFEGKTKNVLCGIPIYAVDGVAVSKNILTGSGTYCHILPNESRMHLTNLRKSSLFLIKEEYEKYYYLVRT